MKTEEIMQRLVEVGKEIIYHRPIDFYVSAICRVVQLSETGKRASFDCLLSRYAFSMHCRNWFIFRSYSKTKMKRFLTVYTVSQKNETDVAL